MKDGDLHINRILEEFYQWVGIRTIVRAKALICTKKTRIKVGLGNNLAVKYLYTYEDLNLTFKTHVKDQA